MERRCGLLGVCAMVVVGLNSGCEPASDNQDAVTSEQQTWTTRSGDETQLVAPGVTLSGEDAPSVVMVETSPLVEFSGEYTWTVQVEEAAELGIDRVSAYICVIVC